MAETTTQTSLPAFRVSTIRRATRLMLSAFVSDDPPYFWTTKLTGRSGLRWTAKRPVYVRSPGPKGSAAFRDGCAHPHPVLVTADNYANLTVSHTETTSGASRMSSSSRSTD